MLDINIIGLNNSLVANNTDTFTLEIFTQKGYPIDSIESNLSIKSNCNYPCKEC